VQPELLNLSVNSDIIFGKIPINYTYHTFMVGHYKDNYYCNTRLWKTAGYNYAKDFDGLKLKGFFIAFSRARFSRQLAGVMCELLFRQNSLKSAYSRSCIFGIGNSASAETIGNLSILQRSDLCAKPGIDFVRAEPSAQLLKIRVNGDAIFND